MSKKYDLFEEQIKEDENKNEMLMSEIEEQKNEIKELQEKLNSLTKNVEQKKNCWRNKIVRQIMLSFFLITKKEYFIMFRLFELFL